jgi:ParB family chromosome partitioning protein
MPPRKTGLGKGLGALIPEAEQEAAAQGTIEVPLSSITPNPHQPRSPIRDQDLVELAASIEEHGVIQPLVVTITPDGYQLITGERRWRAARLARLSKVPVLVKDAAPAEMLALALVENVQRSDLNALEEAVAYEQLVKEFKLTQAQVAKKIGKSREAITNTLRLLKASRGVKEALLAGKISEGHARALLRLKKAEAQEDALKAVVKQGLNVRQTEALVGRRLGEKKPKAAPRKDAKTRTNEKLFRDALLTELNLTRSKKGWRLTLHFDSDEDLEAFYQRIGGEE